jgi:hypothetical protein
MSNDSETSNKTTTVATLRPAHCQGSTVRNGVFYVVRSEAISRDRLSAVQFSEVKSSVGELENCCGSVLMSCCCYNLVASSGTYRKENVRC